MSRAVRTKVPQGAAATAENAAADLTADERDMVARASPSPSPHASATAKALLATAAPGMRRLPDPGGDSRRRRALWAGAAAALSWLGGAWLFIAGGTMPALAGAAVACVFTLVVVLALRRRPPRGRRASWEPAEGEARASHTEAGASQPLLARTGAGDSASSEPFTEAPSTLPMMPELDAAPGEATEPMSLAEAESSAMLPFVDHRPTEPMPLDDHRPTEPMPFGDSRPTEPMPLGEHRPTEPMRLYEHRPTEPMPL